MPPANTLIVDCKGLNTQPNEMQLPPGSLTVAENVDITRDNIVQLTVGFQDFSVGLPAYSPDQLLSVAGTPYLAMDNGLWYNDGTQWIRKAGRAGPGFNEIDSIAVIGTVLYAGDSSAGGIYAIDLTTGVRTLFAGAFGSLAGGFVDGTKFAATMTAIDAMGGVSDIYFADQHCIRKCTVAGGVVTTLAGVGGTSGTSDGTGVAAHFKLPQGIWDNGAGILYVADTQNFAIRTVTYPGGVVGTLTGIKATSGSANGGPGVATFTNPTGIWGDGAGTLYVADNTSIRQIVISSGVVSTLATGLGTLAGLVGNGAGNLYVTTATTVRSVTYPGAVATTIAGSTSGYVDGPGTSAKFTQSQAIVLVDSGKSLLVNDNARLVRKVYTSGGFSVGTLVGNTSGNFGPAAFLTSYADGFTQGPP